MIRILLADQHALIREGLRRILESVADLTVVAEAANRTETLEQARTVRPHVVLVDLSMPGERGLETLKGLKQQDPRVRILVLTIHPEDHFAVRCLKEGADGYMTKAAGPQELVQAIRRLHQGGKYLSPKLAERLALSLTGELGRSPHEDLSDREFEVLRLIGSGKTVGEVAGELHLSVKTVSTYRCRILEKMHLKNNAEIIRYVIEHDLAG